MGPSADSWKMLVKWAIKGRRKTAKGTSSTNDVDRHGVAFTSAPTTTANLSAQDHPQAPGLPVEPETTAQALTARLDRLHYQSDAAFARTSEDEGDRAMRRIHAQERDTKLRDDKLLSLGGPQLIHHDNSQGQEIEPSMPLTEENIEKLVHEQGESEPNVARNPSSPEVDSSITNQSQGRDDSRQRDMPRPGLGGARVQGSQQTITKHIAR